MTAFSRTGARLHVEHLEDRCTPAAAYLAADLVADQPGIGRITDPNLVNAWGISLNQAGGAFWLSSNGLDNSPLYTGDVAGSPLVKAALQVAIPGGDPTGQVFNTTTDFVITNGTVSRPSVFIFASESGAITGWNPQVPPATQARVGFQATDGAVYTGLALASNASGNFLFAADFRNGKIDVVNAQFQLTTLAGSFTDPTLPAGFAPFNIQTLGGKVYVTYARPTANGTDDLAGRGVGFVSAFDTNGNFLQRLASGGELNSPWGLALAPATFGDFPGALLVGNQGDGRINAFDATTGAWRGTLSLAPGRPIIIDGLWGLAFGNGRTAGDATTLYYAAGPEGETHGLFGKITANPAGTSPVSAVLTGGELLITGSRDSDLVNVRANATGTQIVVDAGGQRIGQFDRATVTTIRFNGYAGNDFFLLDSRLSQRLIADGGAGNDFLTAGRGPTLLLGNTGNDVLLGGAGRNILIGGDGRDLLLGQGSDDLLIAGRTTHDANATALGQLLDAWNATTSYEARVAALRAGTGVPKLDATTVFDDGVPDVVIGGGGRDWFFAALGDLHDRGPTEELN